MQPAPGPAIDASQHLGIARKVAARYRRHAARLGIEEDDLLGEAYVGLVVAAREFDPERGAKFSTFAFEVAAHRVCRALHAAGAARRGRGRVVPWPAPFADGSPSLDPIDHRRNDADGCEDAELIGRLLGALGERRRGLIASRYAGGRTDAEAAAELGVSEAAVSASCRAGLRQMREAAQALGLTA